MGFQLPFPQLSNENNPGWLDLIGDYTTQWYRDYDKPFFTDPYFSQPGFNGKDQRVFCRGSTGAFLPDFWLPSTEMDLPCRTLCGSSTSPPRWICPCSRTYASDVVVTQETPSERNWVGHNIGSIYDMYICLFLIMFNSIWDSCFFLHFCLYIDGCFDMIWWFINHTFYWTCVWKVYWIEGSRWNGAQRMDLFFFSNTKVSYMEACNTFHNAFQSRGGDIEGAFICVYLFFVGRS